MAIIKFNFTFIKIKVGKTEQFIETKGSPVKPFILKKAAGENCALLNRKLNFTLGVKWATKCCTIMLSIWRLLDILYTKRKYNLLFLEYKLIEVIYKLLEKRWSLAMQGKSIIFDFLHFYLTYIYFTFLNFLFLNHGCPK